MDGESSKADKMRSTHPNLNPSNVLDSISQEEHMRKTHFDIFVGPFESTEGGCGGGESVQDNFNLI